MDIQRKNFITQVGELDSFNLHEFTLSPFEWDEVDQRFYFPPTQLLWETWQAAKTQAVPEGFVLVPGVADNKKWISCADIRACRKKSIIEAQEQGYD